MTVPQYIVGDSVHLSTVLAVDGVPTDASDTMTLTVVAPDGTETTPTPNHDGTGEYSLDLLVNVSGHWWYRWEAAGQGADEGELDAYTAFSDLPPDPANIRVIVPRIRRAVEGVVQAKWTLTDDEVKDVAADSFADILLYNGGDVFGKTLVVLETDPVRGSPTEYATSSPLELSEVALVATQAALNYFFFRFSDVKTSVTIADEASNYSYERAPTLIAAQLKLLQDQRDKALEAVSIREGVLDSYTSFIAVRDTMTARYIEPWVWGHPEGQGIGFGGLEGDFRFDEIASGGGDYSLSAGAPLLGT